ncbi:hypothetical protein BDR26DRAFT_354404 [Obelidium mucronatum]|nr:hypothetical protein BDR26DRAFT_354404 [Obelidium mucronatum]
MVEGFPVSRRGRAVTDLLLEYEEKRKSEAADNDTVSEKKETNVDETMDDLRLNDAESDMETKSQRSILTLPEDAHSASGDTSSVKNLEWLEEVPKYVKPHKQRLSVSKKSSKKKSESLKSTSKPASKSKSLRPLDSADGDDVYDDDDEEPSAQWPLPSTKTVSKLSDPSYLSLFGRMWNHMSLMVTSETTKYIKTGAASVNMDSFHQVLYKEGNVDMDALGLRSRIFSEKLLKCVHGICNRYGIEWGAVREDLLAFLETLFVREAGGVVLGVVEERILGIAFLKVIANEKGEPFTSDVSLRLMTNDVVCAETGGTMDAAEIGALRDVQ